MPNSPLPPTTPTLAQVLDQALQTGIAHHNAGRLEFAEQLYRGILQAYPEHAEANHCLGVMQMQIGHYDVALEYLTNAFVILPVAGPHWISMAECLLSLQQNEKAIEILEATIAAGLSDPHVQALLAQARHPQSTTDSPLPQKAQPFPGNADRSEVVLIDELRALVRKSAQRASIYRKKRQSEILPPPLVNALEAGNWNELEATAMQTLAKKPVLGKVWGVLGTAYLQLDKNSAALIALTRASELLPNDSEILDHLGVALRQDSQYQAAEKSFKRSLSLEPSRPETWVNLGNLQLNQAKTNQAIDSFQHAIELKPDFFEAHSNMGNALRDNGQFAAAVASFRLALETSPNSAETHSNLGNALKDLGNIEEAITCYQNAITLKPNLAVAHSGLARAFFDRGEYSSAIGSYRRALEIKPDFFEAHSNLITCMYYVDRYSHSDCLDEAKRYSLQIIKKVRAPHNAWLNTERPESLRVGLVSGDLRNHPVGYFLESMLREIDGTRIELFAYQTYSKEDELSAQLRPYFSKWTSLHGLSDEEAARKIHSDGVHILIDLSGHTAHNRLPLFGWKSAPVQASWLGYFATTGVAEMDYLLGDPYVTPKSEEWHFTEKIWRLPESYLCLTTPGVILEPGPLPALAEGRITFGCFNNLNKMNEAVVELWSRVLLAQPDSRLFLKTKQLSEATVRAATRERFAAHGIEAERLLLEGASPRAELLATYNRIDIALDPFPYPGGTTSAESLWMGVPVVTRRGDRFLSHVGESIAHNAGLSDWIANDDDDYVAKAIAYSSDLQQLATLRSGLRHRVLKSPLFDAPRFARHFESALWGMWNERNKSANTPHDITRK